MQETFYRLPVHGLNRPVHLAVVADIHGYPYQSALTSLRRQPPDMILIPGDFIRGGVPESNRLKLQDSASLDMISKFVSVSPTYLSLGNHEWALCPEDISLLEQTGAQLLDNTWVNLDGIVLGGLTSGIVIRYRREYKGDSRRYPRPLPYRNISYFQQFRRGSFAAESELLPESAWLKEYVEVPGTHILLSHHPEYWAFPPISLKDLPIEVVISGHAHGGQARYYSFLKKQWRGMFAPFQGLFPEYTEGIHRCTHGAMIISRGLSNTARPLPRLFNPRELVYVTLEPAQDPASSQS